MFPLATLPTQERPSGPTDPQTNKSPLTYPPCPLSQVLREDGLQFLPIPESAMATELMRHPALQMVLDEVPSCQLAHLGSHCLQRGQFLEVMRMTKRAKNRICFILFWRLLIKMEGCDIYVRYAYNIQLEMHNNVVRKKVNGFVIYMDQLLGKGTYGEVYLCEQSATQTKYAVKIINKSIYENSSNYLANSLKMEIDIHKTLNHHNIVKVVAVIATAHNYYVFQQFCPDGDLRKLIQKHRQFTQNQALYCIQNICAGFQPLVEKGIMHRDLKPENIVIQGNILKLTDFGFAKVMTSRRQMTQTTVGSPVYMSPQVLSRRPYSSKCDVWSIGIIFYELMTGRHPWQAQSWDRLHQVIMDSPEILFPSDIQLSEASKMFIRMCLSYEEEQRLSWLQIYQQQFMGAELNEIGRRWRQAYEKAAERLDWLKEHAEVEVLVGIFLSKRISVMTYEMFGLVMKKLLPDLEDCLIGPMYELFDKDNNGVIDFEQFVGGLSDCSREVLQVLTQLLQGGHFYEQLKDSQKLRQLCEEVDENVIEEIYCLVDNMIMCMDSY